MSLQAGTLGRLWLGGQSAKGTAATTYFGFKANLVQLAPVQITRNIGQLVGGSLLPGDSIKAGVMSGGAVVMPPSLESNIGVLLYAFAGSVSSVDNGDGTYTHYFPSGADSTAPAKYLTARRSVPGTSTLYEQLEDLVVYRLQLGLTPGEFSTLRAEFMGRTPSTPDGSGWTWTGEGQTSIPIGCKGHFELPDGTAVETSAAVQLELANGIPNPQDVFTLGSYYPFDFPVLSRNLQISFTHLWETKTLYSSLHYSGTDWSSTLYSSSLDVEVQSTGYVTGSLPYKLQFYAPNVQWELRNPVELRGGDLIRMEMVGTVADYSGAGSDWYLALTNGEASYAWPPT